MKSISYAQVKRALDIFVSAVVFMATLPVQGLIALLVRARLGRPIIFRQERPGLSEKTFTLLKFRTMHHFDAAKGLTDDASRLTGLGRFLRATSLDELPSLINVLKGDMSLVGPRPLRTHYLPHYQDWQRVRHHVRPGLTGLAQVRGRNATSWDERFRHDVEYVENQSLTLDLKILARTLFLVLSRSGVSHPDAATMVPFTRSQEMDTGTRIGPT